MLFVFLSVVLLLSACGGKIENRKNWPLESFEHTDHNGMPFKKEDLSGKVWVASFIFTNCETVCPPITANMARIQRMFAEEKLEDAHLVSFSVDPEVDKPEDLKVFAQKFTDNLENWHFLTGYTQTYIEQFAKENFKLYVYKPKNDDQVMHGTDIFLIDQEGTIVKYYDGLDVPYEEILHDVKILLGK
ncbi:SCO family protein [Fervidibacillus halotolerans]|uniref:SCO family protein n=1 Tax=Fervidibacillus halotolerans TaxID=2980027 RepID=A0A9E8RZZ0_9BACI|nr:SCO family protein [Fervidibacillus halotolerans]WAA13878.1 SCO family protein [Fervidibacillus halotolerans]